ncbi:hypothetical protein KIP69_16565 [Geobacter sulfurreducens]|uniref:hypothetical protein n=1 Tax=Geobacter sulfurreducens TaxID=35554 RepID=UPI001BDD56CC|nr:hypothetical protein [Geobacter sulfurreducens]QVW35174.1 hypothetical protein KIP69_16565 [Geobacter sulfurreducens]
MYPLVALHVNDGGFVGYRHMPFIHPIWIRKYDLQIEDCEVKHHGQTIGYFEEWQEGYEDEAYSRDLLSAGIRFNIETDWLRSLLKECNYSMLMWKAETRMIKDSWTRKKPTEKAEQERFFLYVP